MGRSTAVMSESSLWVALWVPQSHMWSGLKNTLFLPFFSHLMVGSLAALTALAPSLTAEHGKEESHWGQATSLHLRLPPLPRPWRGVLGLCQP